MTLRSDLCVLALCATAMAAPALAAEAPERELQMLGRCAVASSVYRSLLPPATSPVVPTEADLALYERMKTADPVLRARADRVAGQVPQEKRDAIAAEIRSQFQAQMAPKDGPRKTPREALDLYAPIHEACIVRADMTPAD